MYKLIPFFIFLFAFTLRVYGINWDQNQHLHPDERFLTMTVDSMVWPESLAEYLSPSVSKLNPYNIGTGFYVYGTLPTTLTKYFSDYKVFDLYQYNNIALTGRALSALFDAGVVLLIYLISRDLFGKKTGLLSSFLYAISVLPIQLSHFFAVDTFLNFFLVLSFYFLIKLLNDIKTYAMSLRGVMSNAKCDEAISGAKRLPRSLRSLVMTINANIVNKEKLGYSVLLGFSYGAALACKISALYFFPVILLGYLFLFLKSKCRLSTIYYLLSTIIAIYLAFRFLDPHAFSGSFVKPSLNPQFIQNISELRSMGTAGSLFPPAIQWHKITPIIFPFKNIILWGLGLPLGILTITAVTYSIHHLIPHDLKGILISHLQSLRAERGNLLFRLLRRLHLLAMTLSYNQNHVLILFWILFLFLYQGIQFTPSMRYFLPIYPFLAILSANFSISRLFPLFKKSYLLSTIYYLLILVWPISFLSIYSRPHSRVTASEWIYQNIPAGSTLSCDLWDDCLPLSLLNIGYPSQYKIITMEPFMLDSPQKISVFEDQLKKIDYLILSSNRAWASIPNLPDKYPYMSKFYEDLFAGRSDFENVAEITSYPTVPILNISIPDQSSEEAFTVYDHPKIFIFRKITSFGQE